MVIICLIILTSCGSEISQDDKLIITDINKVRVDNSPHGKYKYTFEGTSMNYWSDSLYHIGDTLQLKRK